MDPLQTLYAPGSSSAAATYARTTSRTSVKSRAESGLPVRSSASAAPAASASATWRVSVPTTYSSDWPGPAWLKARRRTTRRPCVSAYWPPSRSQAALETAYGFWGRSGADSSTGSRSGGP